MFVYPKYSNETCPAYLINSSESEVYEINGFTESWMSGPNWDSMNYVGGYAIGLHSYDYGDLELYVFDTEGDYWSTGIYTEFENVHVLCRNEDCFAYAAQYNGQDLILVEDYFGNRIAVISETEYTSKYFEPYRTCELTICGDYIVMTNMTGEDGQNYCAVFCIDGSIFLPATQCNHGMVTENGNLLLKIGDELQEISLENRETREYEMLTELPLVYSHDSVKLQEAAEDTEGKLFANNIKFESLLIVADDTLPYREFETYYLGKKYDKLTGTVFVQENTREVMNAVLWIVGDNNQVLYQSDVITNVSRPLAINIDVTGVQCLHIGYTGILDQMLLSNAKVWTEAGFTNGYTDETKENKGIDEKMPMSTLLSFLNPYMGELYSPGIASDNMGNSYANCFVAYGKKYSATYDIGGSYKNFKATVAVTKADVNTALHPSEYASLRILGDGELLYENNLLGVDTKPFDLDLDITGVIDLTIELEGKETNLNYYDGLYLILADAQLDQTENTQQTATEGEDNTVQTETSAQLETAAKGTSSLTKDDAAILTLVKKYYGAVATKDIAILETICDPWNEEMKESILQNNVIQSYNNISTYSKKGPVDNSFVVYTYYEGKITNIDTEVPSLTMLYLTTNEEGNLVFSDRRASQEVADYIASVSLDADVQALITDVNQKYEKAKASDSALKEFMVYLDSSNAGL